MSSDGTNQTRGDLNRITTSARSVRWLVAVLVAAAVLGVFSVAILEMTAWRQLRNIEAAFVKFRPESFYLGNELQSSITHLNGSLLQFQLSNNAAEREAFQVKSHQVQELITKTRPQLRTMEERKLAEEADRLYQKYLADTASLLDRGVVAVRRDSASRVQTQLDDASGPLLETARNLSRAQRISLEDYASQSLRATDSVQRTMQISGIALVALIATIVTLIYRALVSPLKARLDETQAAVERQHRLASLGTLATGVAHEIRNPLAAIKLRLFSLKKELASGGGENEDLEVIQSEISRLERIVKDFLQFARPADPTLTRVPAQRLLQNVQTLLKPQVERSAIQLNVEDANGVWLNADLQQLEQVLINLVQNAAESIGRSGSIILRAREGISKIDRQSVRVVILEVADTGKGIPRDAEARIFDPFFSTKEGGTGLGLSIAARIIEMHGGFIQYQTHTDRGTTFSIVLPRPGNDGGTNTTH
jgi:signal transduction histidine kinase